MLHAMLPVIVGLGPVRPYRILWTIDESFQGFRVTGIWKTSRFFVMALKYLSRRKLRPPCNCTQNITLTVLIFAKYFFRDFSKTNFLEWSNM